MSSMRRALSLARRSLGGVSPNPAVGAVVVNGGAVVGEGRTEPPGGRHAEVVALEQAGEAARGGVMYVSLEPCNHHGRTPPCVDAIVNAGICGGPRRHLRSRTRRSREAAPRRSGPRA